MVMAATPRVSSESSSARPGTLTRKLAAVAGAAGAAAIGASEAQAVPYTPTAGIAAAQGIPGFSFVDASNVTLGALRGPGDVLGSTPIPWDVDGSGTADFQLSFAYAGGFGFLARVDPLNGSLATVAATGKLTNMITGAAVGSGLNFNTATQVITRNAYGAFNEQPQFTTGTPGQFGFRFTNAADTYYGWGSLTIDLTAPSGVSGQGFVITEAYYNTTPGGAISVGQVPQAVPEPSSMALLGLGAAGLAAWRARRKSQATAESQAQATVA